MKTHTKTIEAENITTGKKFDVTVKAYKDSGSEWACVCNGKTERFDCRKFTLKAAMKMTADIHG